MLTGSFTSLPVSEVIVAPDRQREKLTGIEELAESIRELGQLHPIILTPENVLVAGERRLRAHQHLGFTHILVQYTTELSTSELELLELEENVRRSDLTWREEVRAFARIHAIRCAQDPEWSIVQSASFLRVSVSQVRRVLLIQRYIDEGDDLVTNAASFTTASNIAERKEARARDEIDSELDVMLASPLSIPASPRTPPKAQPDRGEAAERAPKAQAPQPEAVQAAIPLAEQKPYPIINADFRDWVETPYDGPKLNFLHCDFPYGIDFQSHNRGATKTFGAYDDSPEAFDTCMDALRILCRTHLAKAAHIMFWYTAKLPHANAVMSRLVDMGWKMQPVPLIWHRSDNAGILPDPTRGPRQVYEIAMIGSMGDRKIVQAVSNLCPHAKTKDIHASEKPVDMLRHFYRMFVDESTVMLDPTCGSGNGVIAAELMGAKSVLGLEANEGFFKNAVRHREKYLAREG